MAGRAVDFRMKVGGLHTIAADLPLFRPTHMIRLVDPTLPEDRLVIREMPSGGLLLLRLNDSSHADPLGPTHDHARQILEFLDGALGAPAVRLYVHCHAGVSRSTATAYLALATRLGPGREDEAFDELLRVTVKPWPNRSLVEHADALLGRGGRLLAPLDRYRAAYPRRIEAYRRLHLRRCRTLPGYAAIMGV